ncbi:hypothetical protein, partial [Amycolatopsis sp. SID8362]|uniref:hypothetical protein n=1 Tax=Amycolatopsis sp. SID8362 TaxID=2690346 RepID=UPI00194583BF
MARSASEQGCCRAKSSCSTPAPEPCSRPGWRSPPFAGVRFRAGDPAGVFFALCPFATPTGAAPEPFEGPGAASRGAAIGSAGRGPAGWDVVPSATGGMAG